MSYLAGVLAAALALFTRAAERAGARYCARGGARRLALGRSQNSTEIASGCLCFAHHFLRGAPRRRSPRLTPLHPV